MEEEDLKAELTCPICMDLFREPRRLPCGHVYCRVCLQDMLTRKYLNTRSSERILSCPECRQRYDLTFQEAGVDVFTRDFKLFRLVELFEKKFSRGREDVEGDGAAGAGADDQTAVKTVHSAERESSPQAAAPTEPSAAASSSTSSSLSLSHATGPRYSASSQDQAEGVAQSLPSPALSLSDDSWVYVSPEARQRAARPVLPPAHALGRHHHHHHHHHHHLQHHQRGHDQAWLMPSAGAGHASFPVERGQDVRGSASTDVNYRTLPGGEVGPVVTVSGRYDNVGQETFQRFAVDEPSVQLVRLPANPPPVTSPSSDSSSESESSDERGDEGSEDRSGDEVSGSGSDVGSHGRNRRSRLSRFFRSLVMSDTDSYDEDDQIYPGARVNGAERHIHYPQSCGRDYRQQSEAVMASARPVVEERGGDVPVASSVPNISFSENGAVSTPQTSSEPESMPAAACTRSRKAAGEHEKQQCDSNHNSVAEVRSGQRNAADIRADIAAHADGAGGAVGGVGRAMARPRAAIEVSDDSEEEYEPQTSMLRPKRKPRSRLKKFFTSLLSLSSSDDDEEDGGGGQAGAPPSTSNSERQ